MTMINSSGQIILTVMILYIYIYIYIVTDTIVVIELSFIDCHQLLENAKYLPFFFFLFSFFQYKKGIYFSLNRLKFTATRKHHNKTKLV